MYNRIYTAGMWFFFFNFYLSYHNGKFGLTRILDKKRKDEKKYISRGGGHELVGKKDF